MSRSTLFVVLLACLAACSVPLSEASAARGGLVAKDPGSDPVNVLAAPELDGDDDDCEMEVVDLDEVLASRAVEAAEAAGTAVDTQSWKPKLKKCKGGKCRRKCNAKGKNGACVAFVCVCWK